MPTSCRVWSAVGGEGSEAYMRRWCNGECVMETVLYQAQAPAEELRDQLSQLQGLILSQPTEDVYIANVVMPELDALTFQGNHVTLPLEPGTAERIYEASVPSSLGVEGRGTVYDASLRKSREIVVEDGSRLLSISDQLARFDFPEARAEVLRRLCPTATELEFRPYKLVTYARGDFFAYHADSMSEAMMVGSLALQIPIKDNISSGGGELVFRSHNRAPGAVAAHTREVSADLGRTIDTARRSDGLVTATFAAWLGDVQHEVRPVGHPYRMVLLYRLYKRGDTSLRCGSRFYREMRRQLNAFFSDEDHPLPIHVCIDNTFVAAYGTVSEDAPNAALGSFPCHPETGEPTETVTADVSCIGILTQHRYPPAGLTPEALKGSDAVAYRAITATRECHLVSVHSIVMKPSTKYQRDGGEAYDENKPPPVVRRMVSIAGDARFASSWSPTTDEVIAVWTNAGHREPTVEGRLVGNWDCDHEWWYRSAALMVLPRWSRWGRARWFFAAVHNGEAPHIERLLAVRELFQHVLRFV